MASDGFSKADVNTVGNDFVGLENGDETFLVERCQPKKDNREGADATDQATLVDDSVHDDGDTIRQNIMM